MNRIETRQTCWRKIVGLLSVLPVIYLGSACATHSDGYLGVSSNDQSSADRKERKGVAGTINAAGDGGPVPGATIVPRSLDNPSQPVPERLVLSGSEGQYFWPLKPGTYELGVSADGYHPQVRKVDIEAESLVTLDFVLEKAR